MSARRQTTLRVAPRAARPVARSALAPVRRLPVLREAWRNDKRLWWAFGISFLLHLFILLLQFGAPIEPRLFKDKPLEVVLVNSKSANRPQNAQVLAQTNLDGGGNVDENRRAKTPLPASRTSKTGDQLEASMQRVKELEEKQKELLALAKQLNTPAVPAKTERIEQKEPPKQVSGLDLAANALAMAKLQAQIERVVDEYNQRPRKKFVGTRADEYRFAQYVENWREKIERVGTLNYPDAARGKTYGSLLLTVIIRADGQVEKVDITRSSGQKVLDDAALRIVRLAAPYAPFPPDIRRDTDVLEITRTWYFTRDDKLQAVQAN